MVSVYQIGECWGTIFCIIGRLLSVRLIVTQTSLDGGGRHKWGRRAHVIWWMWYPQVYVRKLHHKNNFYVNKKLLIWTNQTLFHWVVSSLRNLQQFINLWQSNVLKSFIFFFLILCLWSSMWTGARCIRCQELCENYKESISVSLFSETKVARKHTKVNLMSKWVFHVMLELC